MESESTTRIEVKVWFLWVLKTPEISINSLIILTGANGYEAKSKICLSLKWWRSTSSKTNKMFLDSV